MIAATAVAIRVGFVVTVTGDRPIIGDALNYHLYGERIGTGQGMVTVSRPDLGEPVTDPVPSAQFPPLFPYLVGLLHAIGITTVFGQKVALAVIGAITPVVLAFAGRSLRGPVVGVVAGGLAAVYPLLWVVDGSLMSETLFGLVFSGLLWFALRIRGAPTVRTVAVAGAMVGVAALVRGEALLLGGVLVAVLAVVGADDLRGRLRLLGSGALACVVVLTPWTVRNLVHFDHPVLIATNSSAVFVGANCDRTYHGDLLGLWFFECRGPTPDGDESARASEYRRRGLAYARDHLDRLPVVTAARFGRAWGIYRVDHQTRYDVLEGRVRSVSVLGYAMYYPLVLAAIAGAVVLARVDRRAFALLVSVPVGVSLTVVAVYGSTRFRFAAEPVIVLLAAVAVVGAFERWILTGSDEVPEDDRVSSPG